MARLDRLTPAISTDFIFRGGDPAGRPQPLAAGRRVANHLSGVLDLACRSMFSRK